MSDALQKLQTDLDWREQELSLLKKETRQARGQPSKYSTLLRSIWLLLYAHYEGFCKYAWDLYLEELQLLGIKRKDCEDTIVIYSLEETFNILKNNASSKELLDYGRIGLGRLLEEELCFPEKGSKEKIDANSNLNPDLLKENLLKIGMDCSSVERHKSKLNSLVARRNAIAHGEDTTISNIEEYTKIEDAAMEVMYDLTFLVDQYLDQQLYLKSNCGR